MRHEMSVCLECSFLLALWFLPFLTSVWSPTGLPDPTFSLGGVTPVATSELIHSFTELNAVTNDIFRRLSSSSSFAFYRSSASSTGLPLPLPARSARASCQLFNYTIRQSSSGSHVLRYVPMHPRSQPYSPLRISRVKGTCESTLRSHLVNTQHTNHTRVTSRLSLYLGEHKLIGQSIEQITPCHLPRCTALVPCLLRPPQVILSHNTRAITPWLEFPICPRLFLAAESSLLCLQPALRAACLSQPCSALIQKNLRANLDQQLH